MSKAGLIVALILAAVLSAVAYFALKKPPAAPAAPLLGTLDTGAVRTIEIVTSTGRRATLSLGGPGDAYWILEWTSPSGKALKWPAAATRVRAALRLLGALRTAPEAGPGPVVQPATTVTLTTPGLPPLRLTLNETPLGGHTAVSADDVPGVALGEEALAQAFAGDLGAWREPAVFPIDTADASRLELTSGSVTLSLARVGKTWAVVKPIPVHTDGPYIVETLKQLGAAAVHRFVDDSQVNALASSTSRIAVETDRPIPLPDKVRRTTIVQELLIGGQADIAGSTVLCQAAGWVIDRDSNGRTDLWGPVTISVARKALEAISTDPDTYVSRISARSPPPDVGGLSVFVYQAPGDPDTPHFPIGVVRTAEGWRNLEGKRNPAPDAEAVAQAVFTLVTQDRAASVTSKKPQRYVAVAQASLLDRQEKELESFQFGLLADPASDQKELAISSGMVFRTYSTPSAAIVANWLAERLRK